MPLSFFDRLPHPGKSPLETVIDDEPTEENLRKARDADRKAALLEAAWAYFAEYAKTLKPSARDAVANVWTDVWHFELPDLAERLEMPYKTLKTGRWRAREKRKCDKPQGECDGSSGSCVHAYGMQVYVKQIEEPSVDRLLADRRGLDEVEND